MDREDQQILNKYMGRVEDSKNGEVKAMDVATELKPLMDSLKELYDELKDQIVQEREEYNPKEDVIRNGYEIRTQSRTYYKYKQDDTYSVWDQKLKTRKKFIQKATDKGESMVDPETGEIVDPVEVTKTMYPVLKYIGDSVIN